MICNPRAWIAILSVVWIQLKLCDVRHTECCGWHSTGSCGCVFGRWIKWWISRSDCGFWVIKYVCNYKEQLLSCMLAVICKASVNCAVRAILLLCLPEHKCCVTIKSIFCASRISKACASSAEFDSGGCQFHCLTRQIDTALSFWMVYSTWLQHIYFCW